MEGDIPGSSTVPAGTAGGDGSDMAGETKGRDRNVCAIVTCERIKAGRLELLQEKNKGGCGSWTRSDVVGESRR